MKYTITMLYSFRSSGQDALSGFKCSCGHLDTDFRSCPKTGKKYNALARASKIKKAVRVHLERHETTPTVLVTQPAVNPTLTLMHALGWQGGTIHQVSEVTGLEVEQILSLPDYKPESTSILSDDSSGWFAVRTCDLSHNLRVNFPAHRGNIAFWYGVMRGQSMKEQGA